MDWKARARPARSAANSPSRLRVTSASNFSLSSAAISFASGSITVCSSRRNDSPLRGAVALPEQRRRNAAGGQDLDEGPLKQRDLGLRRVRSDPPRLPVVLWRRAPSRPRAWCGSIPPWRRARRMVRMVLPQRGDRVVLPIGRQRDQRAPRPPRFRRQGALLTSALSRPANPAAACNGPTPAHGRIGSVR